ncbi:MAG: hypothetical protein LJE94_16330 [Deltaproteobacteria bacterium]|nr:hypothetical protein [Deltaproteobacteria bacterium]
MKKTAGADKIRPHVPAGQSIGKQHSFGDRYDFRLHEWYQPAAGCRRHISCLLDRAAFCRHVNRYCGHMVQRIRVFRIFLAAPLPGGGLFGLVFGYVSLRALWEMWLKPRSRES